MREFDFTPSLRAKFTFEELYSYFRNVASRYTPGDHHKKMLTNFYYWSDSPIFKITDTMYFYDTTAELLPSDKGDRYLFEVSLMLDNPLFFMNQCVPPTDAIWSGMRAYHGLMKSGYVIDAIVATSTEVMRYSGVYFDTDISRAIALIEPEKTIVDVSLIGKVKQSVADIKYYDESQFGLSNTFMPRRA